MRVFGILVMVFGMSLPVSAQNTVVKCATDEVMDEYLLNHPDEAAQILQDRAELNTFSQDFVSNPNRTANTYVIPVVFHIIHEGGPENISDAQIEDAMFVLNRDFSLRNADTIEIKSDFRGLLSDSDIEFRLAKRDPLGVPTTGINRYFDTATNLADDGIKSGRMWPREKYLNVFVVKSTANGSGGYTYLPGVSANIDAIIVLYDGIGRIGASSEPRSRTLTHECGHWLNLLHTWGDTNEPGIIANCSDDDGITDTPLTEGNSGGCDTTLITCGTLDNIQNYMNYASCDRMFTIGQINWMHAALESSVGQRNNLWTTANLAATGVDKLCEANFYTSTNIVCSGNFVTFTDMSVAVASGWDWSFPTGIPSSSSTQHPYVYYHSPGTHDVTLEATLGGDNESITKPNSIFVVDPIGQNYPYSEGFENVSSLPNTNWYVENNDGSANKWELSTAAGATGTNSAVVKNLGNNKDQMEALVSSSIDLSQLQTAEFSFKYAYAKNGTSVDRIRLYFSTDCGDTWSLGWLGIGSIIETVGSPMSSEFIPTPSQWSTHSLNITSGLLAEGFLYKFELESDSGNQFYVDDINITGTYKGFPVLESPVDGAGNLSDSPVLNWKSVESCAEYEYQLDVNSTFSSGALQTGTTTFISSNPDGTDTEFQTSGLVHGQSYFWRVRSKTNGIPSPWSDTWEFTVSQNGVGFEEMFSSSQLNVRLIPNPVSSEAWVNFNTREGEVINITVLNLLGQEVKSIYKGVTTAGNQSVPFTTEKLPIGVYIIKLQTSSGADLSKFIVK